MRAFLDTSVLVATFYGDHEHHEPSKAVFFRFDKPDLGCAAHSLAEVYSVLTGMPGTRRASGDEVLLFLGDIRERLTIVALNSNEYFKTVEAASAQGIASTTPSWRSARSRPGPKVSTLGTQNTSLGLVPR